MKENEYIKKNDDDEMSRSKHQDPKNSQDSKEFILHYDTDYYLSTFLHPAASGYSMHIEQQCITSTGQGLKRGDVVKV